MRNTKIFRLIIMVNLWMFCLSESHAIQFENCPAYGPIVFGSFATQGRQSDTDGYNSIIGGLGFLWDIYSLSFAKFGIGLSLTTSRLELGDNAVSSHQTQTINYVIPTAFTRLHYGWFFISGTAGVGPTHSKTNRTVKANTTAVSGKFGGMLASFKGSAGVMIPLDNFEITLLGTIDHVQQKKGTDVESSGTFTTATPGGKIKAQQTAFGIRFAEISEPNIFYPEFHLFSFVDGQSQKIRTISRLFEGMPSYVQDGVTPKRNGLNLGGSITSSILGEAILLSAGFDYETRKGYQNYSAFLRIRYY